MSAARPSAPLRFAAVLAAFVVLTGCRGGSADESSRSPASGDHGGLVASDTADPPPRASIVRVVDGDTVDIEFEEPSYRSTTERARLIGIDAPESVSPLDPVQCFGPEASRALQGLLPEGSSVVVERDEEARDRYGRLLVYLHRTEDDLFVNRWMIEQGFADTMFFPPNTTFEADFTRLRDAAVRDHRGLWGACEGPDQPLD